jgi:hypothetical protein
MTGPPPASSPWNQSPDDEAAATVTHQHPPEANACICVAAMLAPSSPASSTAAMSPAPWPQTYFPSTGFQGRVGEGDEERRSTTPSASTTAAVVLAGS